MFCVKCGTELPDGFEFCNKCGAKIQSASEPASPQDTNKVLKKDTFRYFVKLLDSFSKKSEGSLTLYSNRLEWKGGKGDF